MSASSAVYAAFQGDNPEQEFNEDLVFWRERDDAAGYLEDVFAALEVVPGITFNGVTVERDESKFPTDLTFNDIELRWTAPWNATIAIGANNVFDREGPQFYSQPSANVSYHGQYDIGRFMYMKYQQKF